MGTREVVISCSGLVLILAAVLVKWAVFPPIYKAQVDNNLKLMPGTMAYKKWAGEDLSVPGFKKFTIFNFTNPEETKAGKKPILKEVGPFTYRRKETKTNIHSPDGGKSMSYGLHREFVFDKEESCPECFADTDVTVVNFALLIVMDMIKQSNNPLAGLLPTLLNAAIQRGKYKDDIFISVPVQDLLFHGFSTGSLMFLHDNFPQLGVGNTTSLNENGTIKWFNMNTGKLDKYKYTQIELFNGEPQLPDNYWKYCGPTPSANQSGFYGKCHDIYRTDASQQKGHLHASQIWTFNDELCRSFPMEFTGNLKVMGIPAARYEISDSVMDNQLKENLCYCPYIEECASADPENDSWNVTECEEKCPKGTLNLSGCKGGQAIIVSKPHFLHGNPSLQSAISGLSPDPLKHQSYVHLNPVTGVSLSGHFKIQINVPLEQNSQLGLLRKVHSLIFPVVWFDLGGDVNKKTADRLKSVLLTPVTALNAGIGCVIAVGAAMLAAGVIQTYRKHKIQNIL